MQVGDIVYYYEKWSDFIEKGQIEKMYTDKNNDFVSVKALAAVDKNGNEIVKTYGTLEQFTSNLYFTPAEAYCAYNNYKANLFNKYCDEIKSVQDLVKFPLNHCFNGEEYTDENAKSAYIQRVKDILGIDLEVNSKSIENDKEENER
jgi:hypothetical protein